MKDDMNEFESEIEIEPTGEDNNDESQLEEIEESSALKIKKLQAKLKACEAEKTQHLDDLQRAKAEFLNARKRLEDERVREHDRQVTKHIEKLLPLCDSFSMAMSNKEVWEAVDADWRKGVESIHSQLQKILQSYNVTEINPLGEEFDPNVHEAMTEVAVASEAENNTVVAIIQSGYTRTVGETTELIRPARVSVGIMKS